MICTNISSYFVFSTVIIQQVTGRISDLKECDGTHSERSARKVPTLRNQRKHRTNQATTVAHLQEICGLSVALYKHVSIMMLQKLAAMVNKVAADLGFRASKVRQLLHKKYLDFAASSVAGLLLDDNINNNNNINSTTLRPNQHPRALEELLYILQGY